MSAATPDTYQTIVVGAGQAGLAAGYYLRQAGQRFTILDAGERVGDSWRNRWDSLRLFTPARYDALPGSSFPAPRYALPGKDQVADYLRGYADEFQLPVRLGTEVAALRHDGRRFLVDTRRGETLSAGAVIVATGANQRPHVPAFAAALAADIPQLHSSAYRRPSQLPRGKVLVVGAANSGVQIAIDLVASGREVLLSGRDVGSIPRTLLGRDVYDWLWPTVMRLPNDSCLGRRLMRGRLHSGDPLVGMKPGDIARHGLSRGGRTIGAQGGHPVLEGGEVLRDVSAVVWCTGYRPDYGWLELPALGLDGHPLHRRGVSTEVPGLAFLGMRFQHRLGSSLLGGVGEDAGHVVAALTARGRPR
jgi:putative flavoprotein involved in K+ transport